MWAAFSEGERAELLGTGQISVPSEYSEPYVITRRLIDEGRLRLVLRDPLNLPFPVRLLQGTADVDVPQAEALRLLAHATSPDMRLTLVKGADHRFSSPECLALIEAAIKDILRCAG